MTFDMSNKRVQKKPCRVCGTTETSRVGMCRECDTGPAGTWALSYLSELGFILIDDTIENGWAIGSSANNFLGLTDGTQICVTVDDIDRTLFHAKCDINPKEDDSWEDVFWEKPGITQIDFSLGINIANKQIK